MLRYESPSDLHHEELEPGERLVAPTWKVIVRGATSPITGGLFSISDCNLRYTPTWSGLHAVLHSNSSRESPTSLCIPRAHLTHISWERALFFLRSLRMDFLDSPSLYILGSRDVLQQIGEILGAAE